MEFQPKFDNPNAVEMDEFLGLGNKKKKAEKKIKKAEKALASGNIKKAEKKLDKAAKKLGKVDNKDVSAQLQHLTDTQTRVTDVKEGKAQQLQDFQDAKIPDAPVSSKPTSSGGFTPFDPITREDASSIPGGGSTFPMSGGGGGDMSSDYLPQSLDSDTPAAAPAQNPNAEDKKKSPLMIIGIIVLVIIVGYFFFKSFKKK